MDILRVFGLGLRAERLRKGKTQQEAADAMGTDRVSWSLMENGHRNITLDTAERASEAVGLDLLELLLLGRRTREIPPPRSGRPRKRG